MSVKNTAIHVGINFGHDCSLSIFRDGIHLKTKMAEREDSVKQSSHLSLTEISSLSSYLERYAGNNIVFGITNTQGNSFQLANPKVFNFEYLQNQSEHLYKYLRFLQHHGSIIGASLTNLQIYLGFIII